MPVLLVLTRSLANKQDPQLRVLSTAGVVHGDVEAAFMLYGADKFPFVPLGPCRFIINPHGNAALLWIHPACAQDIVSVLRTVTRASKTYVSVVFR